MPGAAVSGGRRLASLGGIGVEVIGGVGPRKAAALAEMGIATVLDLLTHYPRRYVDRSQQVSVRDMAVGEEAMVLGRLGKVALRRTRGGRSLVETDLSDGTGRLRLSFFNQPWRAKQLSAGQQVVVFGRLDVYRGRRQMTNPVVDLVGDRTGRIVPIYPQSDKAGLTTWEIAGWVEEALQRAGHLADPLPEAWRVELGLVDRERAFRAIHAPDSMPEMERARRRLAFDELLRLQLPLVLRKRATERDAAGIRHLVGGDGVPDLVGAFLRRLPFPLTGAQQRAIAEITADMARPHPMHRLLQGDVGAGKTVVALAALLMAVQGGHQGALMAPTEVLAEQHHLALASLLQGLEVPDPATLTGSRPLSVEVLTNRTTAGQRDRLHRGLREGAVDLLVGTHALLTEHVSFSSLGAVVIDEQHRFGVEQRAALTEKGGADGGRHADVLVMTATPIPRTAAMTVFGDLDVTVLDELPAGRRPVSTRWLRPGQEAEAWERVRAEVAAGRQAYVVCPLVEGSEKVQAASAIEEHQRLSDEVLPGLSLAVLHGQLPPKEKDAVMSAFRRGDTQVLVSTTVIEVGVDVERATVMVVESAERFGLAQLHQLRGRVGRGSDPSWCYLLGEAGSPESEARLHALEASTDGFHLAEADLDIRGEGTILGVRQKGRNDLRLASLRRDRELVSVARRVAFEMVGASPDLSELPLLAEEVRTLVDEEEAAFLFRS